MSKAAIILAAIGAISASNQIGHELDIGHKLGLYRTRREPKNKFNLTDEEIELMQTMTPKEKKKFLKGRL